MKKKERKFKKTTHFNWWMKRRKKGLDFLFRNSKSYKKMLNLIMVSIHTGDYKYMDEVIERLDTPQFTKNILMDLICDIIYGIIEVKHSERFN